MSMEVLAMRDNEDLKLPTYLTGKITIPNRFSSIRVLEEKVILDGDEEVVMPWTDDTPNHEFPVVVGTRAYVIKPEIVRGEVKISNNGAISDPDNKVLFQFVAD
jgi:hypothetical protein